MIVRHKNGSETAFDVNHPILQGSKRPEIACGWVFGTFRIWLIRAA